MKKTILVGVVAAFASTATSVSNAESPKYPPVVQEAMSDLTGDNSQVILVLKRGDEEIRLVSEYAPPACKRRGMQYRLALVGAGGDLRSGCWMIVPGSKKVMPEAIIRMEDGHTLKVPLRAVLIEAS